MPVTVLAEAVNKDSTIDIGQGALYSIVAIAMVFAILLIIIGITTLVFKLTGLFAMKAELDAAKKAAAQPAVAAPEAPKEVVITDDDMMAAVLVATIDYRKECKGDVRVVSARELK